MKRYLVHRTLVSLLAIVCIAGTSLSMPLRADELPTAPRQDVQRATLAKQIRELVEQLHAVRHQRLETDRQHREALARLDRQVETLQSQLEPVERATADQRQEIARLEESLAEDEKSAAEAGAWIDLVADRVAPFAARAKGRIERSAAEDGSTRAAELAAALNELAANDPQRRAPGASEALRLVGDGWLAARTVALANEPIVLEGGDRSQHAWVYRLGLASKVFVSEDGKTVGLWSGNPLSPWRIDLPPTEQERIRELIDVVREKQPPAVVPIPIVLAAPPAKGE